VKRRISFLLVLSLITRDVVLPVVVSEDVVVPDVVVPLEVVAPVVVVTGDVVVPVVVNVQVCIKRTHMINPNVYSSIVENIGNDCCSICQFYFFTTISLNSANAQQH